MSGYQRIPEINSNEYPGNAPPAYPQIDYSQNNRSGSPVMPVAAPMNNGQNAYQNYQQPLLQPHQPQPQPQPQPSPYTQPQGTYAQPPAGTAYPSYQQPQPPYGQPQYGQSQPMLDANGQPIYNAYGYANYPVANTFVQPVVVQPGVPGHLIRGVWSDSAFDCFTHIPSCLLAMFFPCIRWAQTLKRANLMSFWSALFLYTIPALAVFCIAMYFNIQVGAGGDISTDPDGHEGEYNGLFVGLYSVMVMSNIFVVIIAASARSKIREKYQIPGSGCEDCLWHLCCNCCAISQEARHVDRDLGLAV